MISRTAYAASSSLRRIFDRRAADFDRVAFLPREIAGRMRERLDYIKVSPRRTLDVGCGVGSDLSALASRYPASQMVGMDFSRNMLLRAAGAPVGDKLAKWMPDALRRVLGGKEAWLAQANLDALPFADNTFDMIWSNQALHWHAEPDQVFPEWQRVLAVGGLLMFSTLGPDTLLEVREAWEEAARATNSSGDHLLKAVRAPVLDFVDMHDFGDMMVNSGFELPVMDMERLSVTYREPTALLADVRGWGAFRPQIRRTNAARVAEESGAAARPTARGTDVARGLGGKALHAAFVDALAARRQADGTIPLTFEIIYGHAWKAAPRASAGQTMIRPDEIGGRKRRDLR